MALTKVTGQVIRNTTDVTVGVLTVTNTLAVGGTVSIGGTLTYEDVTNIDAVGLVTARNGIVVGSGITLSKDGDGFFTGVVTATSYAGDGSGLTGIAATDNVRTGILDVAGVGTFRNDVNIPDKIIHLGDTNTALRFPAADTITAETGGSERLRVASDGKIGIGINDPQRLLHLSSNNTVFALTDTAASTDQKTKYILSDAGVLAFGNLSDDYGTATEYLRIASDGQLLVNATSVNAGAATPKMAIDVGDSNLHGLTIQAGGGENNGDLAGIAFGHGNTGDIARPKAAIAHNRTGNYGIGDLCFYVDGAGDNDAVSSGDEKLRIASDGKVGINTITPNSKLHILASNESGILLEDSSTGNNAPYLEIIAKRTDGNNHQSFSGQVFLARNRTEQKVNSGLKLGTILFGGNHTDASKSNILYAASIAGMSSGDFNSASDMKTDLVFFTGATGRAPTVANVSSGDEAMRITSSGYVRKPLHPNFCARHTVSASYSAQDIVVYNSVSNNYRRWNIGGHYNTSDGKFTCPVDGIYYFEAQVMTTGWSNGDYVQDLIFLNSSQGNVSYPRQRRSYFTTDQEANGYLVQSVAGQVQLSAGQTVWIVIQRACSVSSESFSYFTGWLVQ